ncbi:MAG: hypothetical protein LBC88_07695, partial [Spirochaetaceae bacterium]|nr:hypothetical protein [Spirochaetaceae bacterium]
RRDFGRHGTESAARQSYQIRCNSPIPEKPLARASGLGVRGRNSLIITKEAGSLVILAAMTLPFVLESAVSGIDNDMDDDGADFPLCGLCTGADGTGTPRCVTACPTGALRGDGVVMLERCIQWYASGNDAGRDFSKFGDGGELADIPPQIAAKWGRRLYGCTACQDACPHNRRPIAGTPPEDTARGVLPARLNGRELLALDSTALKARFKGTALGMAWLTADILRRNIRTALGGGTETPRT